MESIIHFLAAQTAPAPAPTPGATGGCEQMGGMFLPIVLMFVIIYFLIIRPQQKQQKRHQAMIKALDKGAKIITNAGILGTITGMTDTIVTLEVAKNVHVKMLRSQIAGLQPENVDKDGAAAAVIPEPEKK
ncbi:MAG TPA: preprotein translocase subunit YajC [Myxococcota bacterium]|nr:preprotein translocase subunit YajC [Myxococcota bacterium]